MTTLVARVSSLVHGAFVHQLTSPRAGACMHTHTYTCMHACAWGVHPPADLTEGRSQTSLEHPWDAPKILAFPEDSLPVKVLQEGLCAGTRARALCR